MQRARVRRRAPYKSLRSMLKYSRFGIQLRVYKVVVGAPRDFKTENMFIEEIDGLAGCASDVTIECDMICFRDLPQF